MLIVAKCVPSIVALTAIEQKIKHTTVDSVSAHLYSAALTDIVCSLKRNEA